MDGGGETAAVAEALLVIADRLPAVRKLSDAKCGRLQDDLRKAIRKALDGKA